MVSPSFNQRGTGSTWSETWRLPEIQVNGVRIEVILSLEQLCKPQTFAINLRTISYSTYCSLYLGSNAQIEIVHVALHDNFIKNLIRYLSVCIVYVGR